jgi:hypothetical protein
MFRDGISGKVSRRAALGVGLAGGALGAAGMAAYSLSTAEARGSAHEADRLGGIYQLQAAFHRAKTTQDIDLMMSLWAEGATLRNQGDPNSPYVGFERLRAFWLSSGSFTHRRFSLVPSFKITIELRGDEAALYFECHDVGDYDLASRNIASDTFLAGQVRRAGQRWLFWDMTAGKAAPLSVGHYYFP